MTEPEEPTFSLIVLSFTKAADDAGLTRALCEAFKFDVEEARDIIQGVPLRVKRAADRATTRQLAGQLLGMGAELCIQNEQTGVEKLYYPGSGYVDDDGPPSREPNPSSRKRAEPAAGPVSRRSADPGASMRDALRQARQRASGEGGAPVSIRPSDSAPVSIRPSDSAPVSIRPSDSAPVSTRPSDSAPVSIRRTTTSAASIAPPASLPPVSGPMTSSHPPPITLSPSTPPTPPTPRPNAPKRASYEAQEAAAARRRNRLILGVALAAVLVLGGVGIAVSALAPTPMIVEVAGQTWKASLPKDAVEGEASSTTMPTEVGVARMVVRTAKGGGPLQSCVLGHVSFAAPPKLNGPAIDRVMQHAVDDLAPGAKLAAGEPVSQGKLSGRQAHFTGATGAGPFGKVRALQVSGGDLALLLVVGNTERAADGPEATAWLESFSQGE
ncbi:MAG: hypothetical protein ABI193_18745 [Minicystis sp.]